MPNSRISIVIVLVCLSAGNAMAQTAPDRPALSAMASSQTTAIRQMRPAMPSFSSLVTPIPRDLQRMTSQSNFFLAVTGATSAAAVHAWDARVAGATWGNGFVEEALEPGALVGGFYFQTGGALATYLAGRVTKQARIADVGAKLFRAQVVTQITTQTVKLSTQRTRPDGTRLSFPSGHTAGAFATATVLHSEFGWKVGVPAYVMAAWVGASRVHMDRHFVSDVVAGATVGLLAGRSVTIGRGPARFAVEPAAVPGGLGLNLVKVGAH